MFLFVINNNFYISETFRNKFLIALTLYASGERYDFIIVADNNPGAYWIQVRGLGECGVKRAQQLAILRYARGPYQPSTAAPTYDVGIPQGVVRNHFIALYLFWANEYCKYTNIYKNKLQSTGTPVKELYMLS